MEAARKKETELLEGLYIDLLAKMNIFLEKLFDFSKQINNQVHKDFFPAYLKKMHEMDSNENDQTKSQYKLHFKSIYNYKLELKQDVDDGKYNSVNDEKSRNNSNQITDNMHTTTNFITNNDIIVEDSNSKKACCGFECLIF